MGKFYLDFGLIWGIERVILGFKLKNYFKLVKRWVFRGSFWVWWILEWFWDWGGRLYANFGFYELVDGL